MVKTIKDNLSNAIASYFHWGRSPYPKSDDEALLAFDQATIQSVREVLDFWDSYESDWEGQSLQSATKNFGKAISNQFPKIGHEGLSVLEWAYSYSWK